MIEVTAKKMAIIDKSLEDTTKAFEYSSEVTLIDRLAMECNRWSVIDGV